MTTNAASRRKAQFLKGLFITLGFAIVIAIISYVLTMNK